MINKILSPQRYSDFKILGNHILKEGLGAVDPAKLIQEQIKFKNNRLTIQGKRFNLKEYEKIHIIGAGKGASFLFKGLKQILGNKIDDGIIITTAPHKFSDNRIKCYSGIHPIPGSKNFRACQAVIRYVNTKVSKNDLIFILITGGASALLSYPHPDILSEYKSSLIKKLLDSPASINEINCVRKHISALKGGRLAELIFPAKIISLILSDIIDSPLEDIGSGPSIGDSTSFSDAYAILQKYNLINTLDPELKKYFLKGRNGRIKDTPLPEMDKFKNNHHFLLGDNGVFLKAAKLSAEKRGIKTHILTSRDKGEATEIAKLYASIMMEIFKNGQPFKPPVLLIGGGESTVTLRGKGKGGRNQEFVLQMLKELQHIEHPFYVLSMGTDGIDGPTDAAGAWIDQKTIKRTKKQQLDIDMYLNNNNSYAFFKSINQLVTTGPTRTNVMDFRMFYIP
jgi:hydroxypyruvate reductase/glycerate 2-kinase